MKFGLQTFTIRREQKRDMKKAYLPLVKMGISSLEVARIDFSRENAEKLRSLKSQLGIDITSIQVKPKYVFGAPEKIIEFCNITGTKNVVISMLPFECILGGEEKFYKFLDTLDQAYDLYAEHGITLAYHHHNWEYVRLSSGKTRMQELLGRTERIKIVHDTYWTARCGIDPALQIREFGERLLGIHLRDLTHKARGIDVISSDGAIGDGVIDFRSVIRAAESVGCSYYVIEQKCSDPYVQIEKSYARLEKIKSDLIKERSDG